MLKTNADHLLLGPGDTTDTSLDKSLITKDEFSDLIHYDNNGVASLEFIVANLNCAGCMTKIEHHFGKFDGLRSVRVNLSERLVRFVWPEDAGISGRELFEQLEQLGFQARPVLVGETTEDASITELHSLLWALGVAGFAAANVMLLSVSVWSGAEGTTRELFHWLSALIALPAIAFAGRPFFRSAIQALKAGQLNMDVPISLAVILAAGLSLYETIQLGEHAFFDAALTLLFFLLIGRTLDQMMRRRAFAGVRSLLAFKTEQVMLIDEHNNKTPFPLKDVKPGMSVFIHPGETIPVDGTISDGSSDVDWSLLNGESIPQTKSSGDEVFSGLINLTGPLSIRVTAVGEQTLLSDIIRLMESANERAPRYRQLADRAAALYAPLVHLAALLTFLGWMFAGANFESALYIAISVLIITCPCALGLAVPVVQVVASSVAHSMGILMKDGQALEKLSEVDTVVFDKTGTLTTGSPLLKEQKYDAHFLLPVAAALAENSLHPLSKALFKFAKEENQLALPAVADVKEFPGSGLRGKWAGSEVRLGSFEWCGIENLLKREHSQQTDELELWVSYQPEGGSMVCAQFIFEDAIRPGVETLLQELRKQKLCLYLLSGDRSTPVMRISDKLGIENYRAEMKPDQKCQFIERLEGTGHKVLMVGDGINDGPSLSAAYVSLSLSSASDVAQVSADFVLMRESLLPLARLIKLARSARLLISQNFGIAVVYNLIAVPVAVAGFVTPIVAAIAMSLSSILVTLNALRLHLLNRNDKMR